MRLWAVVIAAGLGSAAQAQAVCSGDVVFQCPTDAPEATRDQITVCLEGDRFEMVRHRLATGERMNDVPLSADATMTHYSYGWQDDETVKVELGFWDKPYGVPRILHIMLPWDEDTDMPLPDRPAEAWLQSADWQARVEQELCLPKTVYADLVTMDEPMIYRGHVGLFFSGNMVMPKPENVGRARVTATQPVPVYQWNQPNASTPVWWMLSPGDDVDVIDRHGDYRAVAIPTGVDDCMIRPEDMGDLYVGPCATGWVDQQHLEMVQ